MASDLLAALDDDEPDEIPVKRGRGRPPGAKNKVKILPRPAALGGIPGDRERAPSQVPFEVYNVPDPLAMAQALYAEVAWRIDTLRNMRKLGGGVGNRQGVGVETNEVAVPILIDTAATLLKALQAHERAFLLAEKLSKGKTPEQLLEIAIQRCMGQDLATQRGIIKRMRDNLTLLAPISHQDKVQMGETPAFGKPVVGAAEGLADLAKD